MRTLSILQLYNNKDLDYNHILMINSFFKELFP